jgi:hypothetical protein
MEFELWPAIVAGLAGGLMMSALMTMMRSMGKTEMDMALLQGSMFTDDRGRARAIGLFTHLVMMSAVVFGSIYALLFAILGVEQGNAWWVGGAIGVVHGLLAGMGMAMMPSMHPRMPAQAQVGEGTRHSLQLEPPGLFGKNYGGATPPGMLMAHIIYGIVVGLVYALLAG